MLLDNGVMAVSEGGQHALHPRSGSPFQSARILYAPGKAANAGGVSVSGLEMSQNSARLSWTAEEVAAVCTKSWKASTRLVCNTAPRLTVM